MENDYFTYIIIKPDALKNLREILNMFYKIGLEIDYFEFDKLTKNDVLDYYEQDCGISDTNTFLDYSSYILSDNVLKILLYDYEGNITDKLNKVVGNCYLEDTIRGNFQDKQEIFKNILIMKDNKIQSEIFMNKFNEKGIFDFLAAFKNFEKCKQRLQNSYGKKYVDDKTIDMICESYSKGKRR